MNYIQGLRMSYHICAAPAIMEEKDCITESFLIEFYDRMRGMDNITADDIRKISKQTATDLGISWNTKKIIAIIFTLGCAYFLFKDHNNRQIDCYADTLNNILKNGISVSSKNEINQAIDLTVTILMESHGWSNEPYEMADILRHDLIGFIKDDIKKFLTNEVCDESIRFADNESTKTSLEAYMSDVEEGGKLSQPEVLQPTTPNTKNSNLKYVLYRPQLELFKYRYPAEVVDPAEDVDPEDAVYIRTNICTTPEAIFDFITNNQEGWNEDFSTFFIRLLKITWFDPKERLHINIKHHFEITNYDLNRLMNLVTGYFSGNLSDPKYISFENAVDAKLQLELETPPFTSDNYKLALEHVKTCHDRLPDPSSVPYFKSVPDPFHVAQDNYFAIFSDMKIDDDRYLYFSISTGKGKYKNFKLTFDELEYVVDELSLHLFQLAARDSNKMRSCSRDIIRREVIKAQYQMKLQLRKVRGRLADLECPGSMPLQPTNFRIWSEPCYPSWI